MSHSPSEITSLNNRARAYKGLITRVEFFLVTVTNETTLTTLSTRYEKLEEYYAQYEAALLELLFKDETNEEIHFLDMETIQTKYLEIKDKFLQLIATRRTTTASPHVPPPVSPASDSSLTSPVASAAAVQNIKLSKIQIPFFTGGYDEWKIFSAIFKNLIHNNQHLDKIQKFYYLKEHLKRAAAKLIQELEETSDNYDIAWSILEENYDNKISILNKHLRDLFELQRIGKNSSSALRSLTNEFTQHVNIALKGLGIEEISEVILILFHHRNWM